MVLLITGTTGIAEATAELAVDRGHEVHAVGLPDSDLTSPEAADEAVDHCVLHHGRLDGLFHVAGASGRRHGDGPLHECTSEGWRFTLDANLTTAFHIARAALRQMLRQDPGPDGRRGALLLMSSVLATSPEPRHFATHAYAAAKGAVISLGRAMAAYYAPHGIRVNVIAPGLVRTPMTQRAQADEEIVEWMRVKQPLAGDLLAPGDIARAALFLLGDESAHITGQVLGVDAGWSVS
jgi:NAD(P)-dependent dehydrogenase (short-subunit alcohol dehydrogenase family)